ncbi:hypothetical protein LSH36_793g01272 [Paralvinella palmiformis]|uniref:Citrate transporter-like domain-containing protein n=1 Tax=Paralvinella palmiformis TaxID=53620 RepID=A0AAD9IZU4_9ANNE|nr:hypothetical protein LSH36_793g01272 [Paralvinella palmiformis]
MFSLGLTAAVISGLVANTTTTLLLVPIALFLSEKRDLKMRFVLSVAYGATIGGIMTPIGTPPNAILMGFLEDQNLEALPFVGWMGLTIPLAIAMLLIMPYILSFGLKNIPLQQPSGTTTLNGEQKRLVYILVAMIFLLLINSPIKPYYTGLGLNEKAILLGAGLLMFFPKIGFLEWTDARKIPYEIMFLFGAGFSIAKAFSATGLAKTVASLLLGVTSFGPVLLLFIVALLIASTTELTSNTALTSIALPIIFALGQQVSSVSTNLMLMVATVCASYAFMLPIATPPNAIAAGSGAVRTKDMIKFGVYLNIVGIVLIVIFANVFWVYFLK